MMSVFVYMCVCLCVRMHVCVGGVSYGVKDYFELLILLIPKFLDYRHLPLHLAYALLGMDPRPLCMIGKLASY